MDQNEWFEELTNYYGLLDDEASDLVNARSKRSAIVRYKLWLRQRREDVLHIMECEGVSWDRARLIARCKEDELDAGSGIDFMNDERSCAEGRLVH